MIFDAKLRWFIFQGDCLLLIKDSTLQLPTKLSVDALKFTFLREHQIGKFNDVICYCAEISRELQLPPTIESIPLRKAFEVLGMDWYVAAAKAYSIIHWDKNHLFCGACGNPTIHRVGSFERVCSACNLTLYPRISPSMIVLIEKGNEILMARSPHFPPGVYGLVAGFVEMGESIEDAVHREVKEEVGIKVKNLRYFGSQSWPFPDSLMIGFFADYASGEIEIDGDEIEAAGWYAYDSLPGRPSSKLSIAGRMLDAFIKEKNQTNSHHGGQ